ncbi:WW domain-binding protein isoform 3 [Schistosoma japonicum]|uniref:WW domain-binding protein isoform 3 n=1 Tax=Schistosoma japonicum TaxID=6182 RepID=A0A4Z2CP92_SCHJA|nr:WW domain-binding protein isoform 3 [Schistosoma japonicum]
MSMNQSHSANGNGVVLFHGERMIFFYDGCDLKLDGRSLKFSHNGRVYLTSHRVIFINKKQSAGLLSFSMPFVNMREVDIEQPVFGANYIKGIIMAEPTGGWQGEAKFSLTFKKGGAIEFGKALIELGRRACDSKQYFKPPNAYSSVADTNVAGQYYAYPPPAYYPPYNDPYYSFLQPHEAFTVPQAETLYHVRAPPPYPGATPTTLANDFGPTVTNQYVPPYPANLTGENASYPTSNSSYGSAFNGSTNVVGGGYYFPEDPHNVYVQPNAPNCPNGIPSYMEGTQSNHDQPPPYPTENYSQQQGISSKKNQ